MFREHAVPLTVKVPCLHEWAGYSSRPVGGGVGGVVWGLKWTVDLRRGVFLVYYCQKM